jgi:hypothetical protein
LNIRYLIFENLVSVFWVKILKFFDVDPGWKKIGSGIQEKHPGSATLECRIDLHMSRDSTHDFYLEIRIPFPIYGLGFPELHKSLKEEHASIFDIYGTYSSSIDPSYSSDSVNLTQ